jgi:protein-S-isoprenylcysteine O-methyltransferase Ste14
MTIKRENIESLIIGLISLVVATILSIIFIDIIRENIGLDVVSTILFPVEIRIPQPFNLWGFLPIVLGFLLIIWALFTLFFEGKIRLGKRSLSSTPFSLVIKGPYKFSRNPIYLSEIMFFFGAGIYLGSLTFLILSITLFFIFQKWVISWEEKKLEGAFGEEYREYKKRVRRWL